MFVVNTTTINKIILGRTESTFLYQKKCDICVLRVLYTKKTKMGVMALISLYRCSSSSYFWLFGQWMVMLLNMKKKSLLSFSSMKRKVIFNEMSVSLSIIGNEKSRRFFFQKNLMFQMFQIGLDSLLSRF